MSCEVRGFRNDGRCEVLIMDGSEEKTLALKTDNLFSGESKETISAEQPVEAEERKPRRSFQEAPAVSNDSSKEPNEEAETKRERRRRFDEGNQGGVVYV